MVKQNVHWALESNCMDLIILTDSVPYVSWGIGKERNEIPNLVEGKP